jgi:hypothetical protein
MAPLFVLAPVDYSVGYAVGFSAMWVSAAAAKTVAVAALGVTVTSLSCWTNWPLGLRAWFRDAIMKLRLRGVPRGLSFIRWSVGVWTRGVGELGR